MTLKELQQLEEILTWANGKVMSAAFHAKVTESLVNVRRDIRLKTVDFVTMKDVNGNLMNGGE